MNPQKIVLDTDIGDDIDDALALALVCACPELELLGISTVFGNVKARSRQARTILKLAGERFANVPVAAGCGAALTVRSRRGIEACLRAELPCQDASALPETELTPPDERHGAQLLIDIVMSNNGDVIPIAIGPLTNLAVALTMEPRLIAKIPKLCMMAGEFRRNRPEYNVHCDPEAAAIVFASGIPIEVVPWDAGRIATFDESHLARLRTATHPLARNLMRAIELWLPVAGRMPSLYDPLTIVGLLKPESMDWKQGEAHVELQGDATYGYTTFRESSDGPHRMVWDVDREVALEFYLERILEF